MAGWRILSGLLGLALLGGILAWAVRSRSHDQTVDSIVESRPLDAAQPITEPRTIVAPPTNSRPAKAPEFASDQILVRFSPGTPPAVIQKAGEAIGATQSHSYRTPGLVSFSLPDTINPQRAKEYFEQRDDVDTVEKDRIYALDEVPDDPDFPLQWGLQNLGQDGGTVDMDVNAPEAWAEIQDSGNYVVAIIDTGADLDHPDLAGTLWTNPFEIPDNGVDDDGNGYVDDVHGINQIQFNGVPDDDHGHGSHVAGTIAAAGNNGVGTTGVMWNAQLLHCKVFSEFGWTTLSRILTCVDYVVWAKDAGIDIIAVNASWSGGYSQLLSDAVIELRDRDILVVAAAGNDGTDIDADGWYPAAYPYDNVIAVAAMDRNGDMAPWSNYGAQNVDIVAPGVDIWSTYAWGGWTYMSGTSMAAPHVTGVVALIKASAPNMSMAEVRDYVFGTAVPDQRYTGRVATGGRLRIVLPFIDLDGDGMTDRWETRFGLDPADPADAGLDPDGDGLSNLEEYANTTHPDDADRIRTC